MLWPAAEGVGAKRVSPCEETTALAPRPSSTGRSQKSGVSETFQQRARCLRASAGAAGEMVRLGSVSMSAHVDFVTFESIAPYYLLAAGRPIIADPTSVEQHEFNSTAIARLRAEMLELATRVIEANREQHAELTSMLIARSELAYDDVLPVLAQVRAVSNAPAPIWAKTTVTHRLPRV